MLKIVTSLPALLDFTNEEGINVWSVRALENTASCFVIEYSDATPKDEDVVLEKQDGTDWHSLYLDVQDQVNDTQNAYDAALAREDGLIVSINEWRDRYYETLGELNKLKAVSDAETPVDTKPQSPVDFISQLGEYAVLLKTILPK